MATAADHFVGLKAETVYGTAVTVDRFYPFVDGTEAEFDTRPRVGKGIAGGNGRRTQLGQRAYITAGQGTVKIMAELESRAAGVLLGGLGVSTSAVITGGTQQQHHLGITGMVLPSYTIQIAKVDNSGAYVPETYRGCTPSKISIEQPEDDIAMIEIEYDALAMTRGTAAAVPSYASSPTIFDQIHGSAWWGGTFTAPTTTALASLSGAANTQFRSWKLEIDQKISDDRWVLQAGGLRAQPLAGTPEIKFTADVEFGASDPFSTDYLAGTKRGFVFTWTTGEVVAPGFAQLQVAVPQILLSKGLPQVKPGETPTTSQIEGMVMSDGANRDLYVLQRTADTAF